MERMHLQIDGMSCGHCVASVKKALGEVDGVAVDSVSVGSADLRYDPASTDREAILGAVSAAGYPARASGAATS
jgi:copper chaperone CopZ